MNKAYQQAQLAKRIKAKYPFVKIGNQYWTTKNFAETQTVLNTPITNVTDNTIWASSQTLYTNKYNERIGLGDTVEQATYAAVKVSAFWCNYNNDPALGAIYGKLYNWFAVKLIQMDINYYNAQLLATYGNTLEYYRRKYTWRTALNADSSTISSLYGGDLLCGGKFKATGTILWNSPNTGADNLTGLNFLGSGFRNTDGSFSSLGTHAYKGFYTEQNGNLLNFFIKIMYHNSATYGGAYFPKTVGCSIRFIKG